MEGCGREMTRGEEGRHGTVDVIQFQPLSKGVLLTALIDSVSLSTSLNFVIAAIFVLRLTVNKRLDDSYRVDVYTLASLVDLGRD